jgi:hypothetical protein
MNHLELEALLPDPETYLRNKALEMRLAPPYPKGQGHIGYICIIMKDGDTTWGELTSPEPLDSESRYHSWAVETAASLQNPPNIEAIGFSYDVMDSVYLFRITPRYVMGEMIQILPNQTIGEWVMLPKPDGFAQLLWEVLR